MKNNFFNRIFNKVKPETIFWLLLFVSVFSVGFIFRMQSYDVQYNVDKYNVITSDGIGYYSYLPSVFISKEMQTSQNSDHYLVFDGDTATKQNKYFVGSSVLMLPFFGVAHSYTLFNSWLDPENSFAPNGYSFPYHLAIVFAGVFYLLLGLFYIKKTVLSLGVRKEIIYFLIVFFALGSQLMGLSSYEASFSHVYAFFTISYLLYYWQLFTLSPNLSRFLIVIVSAALLIIIRPTDILIILSFPMFLVINGVKDSLDWFKKQHLAYVYMILIGALFLFFQLYFWKLQSGVYFLWSYTDEGFDFSNPEIWNVLFSYKKGLFVYTPLLIIVLTYVLISSIKTSIKIWFLTFFVINTYVISSWWCWWYGGSFGMRPWMDFMPVVIIVCGLSLNKTKLMYRLYFYLLAVFTIPINIIQNYQYSSGKMHWDTMTKDKYWQIFLETDSAFDFITYDPSDTYKNYDIIDSTIVKIENTFDAVFSVEKNNMYHTLYNELYQLPSSDSVGTYVNVSFDGKLEFMRESAVLSCNRSHVNNSEVKQESQRVISYIRKTGQWTGTDIVFDLGSSSGNEKELSFLFYNNQRNFFWFRNVTISLYHYKIK